MLVIAVGVALAAAAGAQQRQAKKPGGGGGGGGPSDLPFNAALDDLVEDGITSDGGTYFDGVDNVDAQLPGSGNFVIVFGSQGRQPPTRHFSLLAGAGDVVEVLNPGTTGDPVFHDGITSALGDWNGTRMSVNSTGLDCAGGEDSTSPRDMALDDCLLLNIAVHFDIPALAKTTGRLRCGSPNDLADRRGDPVAAECTAHDGNRCTEWAIAPIAAGSRCLMFENGPKNVGRVDLAIFEMPMGMTVTLQ